MLPVRLHWQVHGVRVCGPCFALRHPSIDRGFVEKPHLLCDTPLVEFSYECELLLAYQVSFLQLDDVGEVDPLVLHSIACIVRLESVSRQRDILFST